MRALRRRTLAPIIALTLLLPLGACSAENPTAEEPVPSAEETTPSETSDDGFPRVAECDAVELSAETVVDGQSLGDCVTAAMLAAGTGVQRVDASDGTSSVVSFRWDPDFAMSVDGGTQQVVIIGDTGWVQMPGTGWVQSDPGSEDPVVVMATGLVELTRVFSDPRVMSAGFATSPTWTVVGEEPLPVDDADATTAWLVTPDSSMTIAGVALTDVQLWLRPDHLGAYFVGTGSIGGVSVTTSNTFLDWGTPVEISAPDEG